MIKLTLMLAIVAAQIAFSLSAKSQTFSQSIAARGAIHSSGEQNPQMKPTRPGGKPGLRAGNQGGHFTYLTPQECRKLGGKTTIDDSGACKLRMRCTIIHGNGDVNSSCIDEAE